MAPGDAELIQQIRRGDPDASYRFVREYYPGIYRYLLYLTGRPEQAEDLTQETFLQAWSGLDSFQEGAPLRPWLHRIAHREFLQALRRQRPQVSLEQAGEIPAPGTDCLIEAVDLRTIIDKLPLEEREMVVLHYLEGYRYDEVARIMGAPVGRVRHRLSEARARLQQEFGDGDLVYLNPPGLATREWAWLPLDQMRALEARLRSSRREGDAAAGAPGTAKRDEGTAPPGGPPREADIVDPRLTRPVTLALKATALVDVCEQFQAKTGVSITAGPSVADEKVSLFCEKRPLREVMRQLSRPFGYTWLRSGTPGQYRYELVQQMGSQLLEEELRNRDRSAALLTFEREMERFHPYLDLSPEEALARAKTAPAEEKPLLEQFAGRLWGAVQMYYRLSPQQLATARAGQELQFRLEPGPGELPLPPEIARGVLESQRDWRMIQTGDHYGLATDEKGETRTDPETLPLTAVPNLRGKVGLRIHQAELGRFALYYEIGWQLIGDDGVSRSEASTGRYFSGQARPTAGRQAEVDLDARQPRDPALRVRVSIQPEGSFCPGFAPPRGETGDEGLPEPKVTTADVLEALHRATGLPVVADFHTRRYQPETVAFHDQPLGEALSRLAAAMNLRWNKYAGTRGAGAWLQFRSASYYNDRPKEVPNRLLARWAERRQQHGFLSLDDLVEIAALLDEQLAGEEMAEGAREWWDLKEWDVARNWNVREGLRLLAEFTPALRQKALTAVGLPFAEMPFAQQQRFLAIALNPTSAGLFAGLLTAPLKLEELAGAALRVEYTQPGGYRWQPSRLLGYPAVVPLEPGPQGRLALLPSAQGRTREEALQAARRIDPRLREGLMRIDLAHQADPSLPVSPAVPQEAEIVPTTLDLWLLFFLGPTSARPNLTRGLNHNFYQTHRGWE